MAKFITLTEIDGPKARVRVAVDHIIMYSSPGPDEKGGATFVTTNCKDDRAYAAVETPEQIDALIAAAESGQPIVRPLTWDDMNSIVERAMHLPSSASRTAFIDGLMDSLKARGLAK